MNFKSFFLGIVFSLIVFLVILIFKKSKHNNESDITKTDTVFINKPIELEPEFKFIEVPYLVTKYLPSDTVKISKVEIKTDTLRLYYQDSTYLNISSLFLTQYPKTDRLLQMLLDNDNLKLNLQNTKGEVYSKEFKINLNSYSYNYVNNKLTSKKVSFYKKFDFFTELTVRPFNNLWDLDLGLEYKTNKFNYTLGLNGFYYPNQKKDFGSDLFLRIRYKF